MIVGRSGELEWLDRALSGVDVGNPGRALVVGDLGLGKSVLLGAAGRRASRRGWQVVRVRAAPGERDLQYALLDDLYRAAGATPPAASAGTGRRSTALLDLLLGMATDRRVALLVDDAHNADDDSLEALLLAMNRAGQAPLTAVVATRPDERVERQCAQWDRLDLAPLTTDASVTLLRATLGPTADASVLGRLAQTLQGHPLALTEVTRLLSPEQLSGVAPLPDHLPVTPTLAAVWQGDVRGLPDRARCAVTCLAVVGDRMDLLAAVLDAVGCGEADLDPAVAARLVAVPEGAGPRFTHPMVREVVLDCAPPEQLREIHAQAAAAARTLGLPPALVVRHLGQSVVLPDGPVADEIAQEATRAEQQGHFDVACRAWEAAARLSPAEPERVERALHGILLVVHFGLGGSAIGGLLDLVAGSTLDPEAARWVRWLEATRRADTDPAGSLTSQWAAIDDARRSAPALLPDLLWEAALTAWTLGDPEQGLRAARELAQLDDAGAIARSGIPLWTGTALLAVASFEAGDVTRAMQLRAEAIARADSVDATALDTNTLLDVIALDDLLLNMSEPSAQRLVLAEQRLSEASEPLACLRGIQAWRARARGDWDAARALLAIGRPLADRVGATGAQRGMAALATELATLTDDDAAVRREAGRLRALAGRFSDRRRLTTLDRSLGLRALVEGRLDAAVASLAAAADVPFLGRGLRDGVVTARVDLVEALVRSEDGEAAAARAAAVRPLLTAMGTPLALALSARAAALVADTDAEADRWFREALRWHEEAQDPFEEGRTLLLYGEHLRRSRRRRQARAVLQSSVRLFEALGATPWTDRAGEELRACGGSRVADVPSAGVESLTAQERAVATAVATGGSNREVAEALFLSPRTVEYHLGNAYRKLGVHGRTALARRLLEERSDAAAVPVSRPRT